MMVLDSLMGEVESMKSQVFLLISVALLPCCLEETDGPPRASGMTCPGAPTPRQPIKVSLLSAFRTCCDGTAHLAPRVLIPSDFAALLVEKPDDKQVCVPDLYVTNPEFTPNKCSSLFGSPGACISSCVSQIGKAPLPLPKDVCQGNELCAPCIDPRTRKESGACRMGELACDPTLRQCQDWQPTLDLTQYPPCCQKAGGAAHCAPKELVPGDLVSLVEACALGQGSEGVCVPDKMLARGGGFTPKKCKSIGDLEGRCTSICVPAVARDMAMLPRESCDQDERCAPCYNPRTGKDTGACRVGLCDQGPTEPARPFQGCGVGGAATDWCVPASMVQESLRANFDSKGCLETPCTETNTLCVPRVIIETYPNLDLQKCEVGGMVITLLGDKYKDGRCVSRCMKKVSSAASMLAQVTCGQNELCVPCLDPLNNGAPAGLCPVPAPAP